MSAGIDPLDRLATHSWVGDWDDVLLRAGEIADSHRSRRQIFTRRRVVLALAVLAVVLLPFVALAATHDWSPWWFFESGHVPRR